MPGHNSFVSRLCETAECSEHCRVEFSVKVRDVHAPVTFYIDKVKIDLEDERFSYSHLERGEHMLVIHKVRLRRCELDFNFLYEGEESRRRSSLLQNTNKQRERDDGVQMYI